ncbi:MAG: hypothetical protein AB8B80_09205 [Marinicellaceae bacterium]
MNQITIILMLFCFLTACGGSDESAQNTQQKTKNTANSDSSSKSKTAKSFIKVSGAENFTFTNEPKFTCREGVVHVMTMTTAPKFQLYLSSKAGNGALELADYDANRSSNYVEGKSVVALSGNFVKGSGSAYGKFYYTNSKGQVTVEKIPAQRGETFKAKVKATLESTDGQTINVDADLNLVADGYMMQNCHL